MMKVITDCECIYGIKLLIMMMSLVHGNVSDQPKWTIRVDIRIVLAI